MGDEFDFEGVAVAPPAVASSLLTRQESSSGSSEEYNGGASAIDNNNDNKSSSLLLRRTKAARRKYASETKEVKFQEPTEEKEEEEEKCLSFSSQVTTETTAGSSSSTVRTTSTTSSSSRERDTEQNPSACSQRSNSSSSSSTLSRSSKSRRQYGRKRTSSSQQSLSSSSSSSTASRSRRRKKTFRLSRQEWTIGESQLNHDDDDHHYNDDYHANSQGSNASSSDGDNNNSRSQSPLEDEQITKVVVGHINNALGVQDAGSNRMLFDDVSYLCESILSSSSTTTTTTCAMPYLELTNMLSNAKTRCILWKDQTTTDAILNVLGQAAQFKPTQATLEQLKLGMEVTRLDNNGASPPHHDDYNDDDEEEEVFLSQNSKTSQTSSHASSSVVSEEDVQQQQQDEEEEKQKPSLLLLWSLSAMAQFISWDCTISSSSKYTNQSSFQARKLRRKLLEHTNVVRSLSHLILQDDDGIRKDWNTTTTTSTIVLPLEMTNVVVEQQQEEEPPASPAGSTTSVGCSDDNDVSLDSFGSMGSSTSLSTTDPTRAGRRRRRKRNNNKKNVRNNRLAVIREEQMMNAHQRQHEEESDNLSFFGTPPPKKKKKRILDDNNNNKKKDMERIKQEIQTKLKGMTNNNSEETTLVMSNSSMMALTSLNRIIQGREGDGASCLEQEDEDDIIVGGGSQGSMMEQQNQDDEENETDPLLVTNSLLYTSESLPIFAQSMTETLTAIRSVSPDEDDNGTTSNASVRTYLSKRLSVLSSIIDGCCLLSLRNRRALCEDGFLIGAILALIQEVTSSSSSSTMEDTKKKKNNEKHLEWLLEMILLSLRTLTSLSHDNAIAGTQIMKAYSFVSARQDESTTMPTIATTKGIQTLVDLLHSSANEGQQQHVHFDIIVFCLNIITNIIGTSGVRTALLGEVKVTTGLGEASDNTTKEVSFVTWLTDWTVAKTTTFRDAALTGTFGAKSRGNEDKSKRNGSSSSSSSHPCNNNEEQEDVLDKEAEEHILAAGNGFILLAGCMRDNESVRAMVLERMDSNGVSTGLKLMKNTLKAFCNVYKFSLGALSMGVVTSVKSIICDLEKLE